MPYDNISQLPEHVKKYPDKKQRQWMHVNNQVYKSTNSDERALKAADAVVGRSIESNAVNDRHTNFIYQIDKYLGIMRE
jgi:hypothetical protein